MTRLATLPTILLAWALTALTAACGGAGDRAPSPEAQETGPAVGEPAEGAGVPSPPADLREAGRVVAI